MRFLYLKIKNLAKYLFFKTIRYSGIPYLIREILQSNKVTIIGYHELNSEIAKKHFAYLQSNYNVISLKEYINFRLMKDKIKLPKKSLIITIDDGFASNYHLIDIFKESNIPVTIFITSGVVGTSKHFWFKEIISENKIEQLKLVSDDARLEYLKSIGFSDDTEYLEKHALSLEEIKELNKYVDFQSHTVTHPILTKCSDEKVEYELKKSKTDLENITGKEIYCIAYPNGDFNQRDIELTKKANYTCGLTVDLGFNSNKTNLYKLKRISISDSDDIDQLVCRVCGLWPFFRIFKRIIQLTLLYIAYYIGNLT